MSTDVTELLFSRETSSSATNDLNPTDDDGLSLTEHASNLTTKKIQPRNPEYTDYVGKITLPIALLLGGIGNSITIATMVTQPFKAMTWSVILIALAVADTLVLFAVPFNKPFIIELLGVDVPSISRATCKVYHLIRRTTKMTSAWLVVLVCFERFIAVCFPMKVKQICTRRRTTIGVVCVVMASAVYSSILITTADRVNGTCVQTVITPASRSMAMMLLILGSVLIVVLPIAIMFVLTPVTCFVLRKHMLLRTQLSSTTQTDNYTKATAMLISLCVAYVVLLTPAMVGYNIAFYRKESMVSTRDTTLIIIREVSQVMELINYSSNFFLYTAFNDIFRKRLLHCLTCNARNAETATSCTPMRNVSVISKCNTPTRCPPSNNMTIEDTID